MRQSFTATVERGQRFGAEKKERKKKTFTAEQK